MVLEVLVPAAAEILYALYWLDRASVDAKYATKLLLCS